MSNDFYTIQEFGRQTNADEQNAIAYIALCTTTSRKKIR